MNRFKDKMARFMYGRYGMDQLSRNLSLICLVLLIVTMFVRNNVIYMIALVGIVYTYFRIFSRNISKRAQENQKYLSATAKLRQRLNKEKNMMKQRKDYHIYTCPSCGQKVRIPRGKGKIEISCPKCHSKFVKRS